MKYFTSLNLSIVAAILIVLGSLYFVAQSQVGRGSPDDNVLTTNSQAAGTKENNVIKDGVQYVTITARGGYSPRVSVAKSGIPTKLVIVTNGTYDCSASLVIKSLNFRKILPNTGETIVDAGTPKAGGSLQGVCGMGMYSFVVQFK